ncbi:MAG: SDR family oxidoreductase [Massilia sp.]
MILLTGASGTIGRETLTGLRAMGEEVRLASRAPHMPGTPDIEVVAFDWDNPASYRPAMEGADKLFLLTPNSERQAGYVLQAVAVARRVGIKRIVRLSVHGADDDPGIALTRQHLLAEKEIRQSGLGWTILRPAFFMENFTNYYGVNPNADSHVLLPNGTGKAAWTDPADIGEAAAKVLAMEGYEGQVFELTGPELLSTAEALAILGEELGHDYRYVDVPEDAARKAMEDSKTMPEWLVDAFLELNALVRNGHAETVKPGIREILGREPRSLRDWARRLAARR